MPITDAARQYEHKPKTFLAIPMLTTPWGPSRQSENRIRQAFLDVNMAYQHASLTAIAEKGGITVGKLQRGDFLLFVNASWTKAKLLGNGGILLYIRAPKSSRISPQFLLELPRLFNSDRPLLCDPAMGQVIEQYLARRAVKEPKPKKRPRKVKPSPEPVQAAPEAAKKTPEVIIVRKRQSEYIDSKGRVTKVIRKD